MVAKKSKGRIISVDFEGVSGNNKVPDGEYLVEVSEVESKVGGDSGQPYLEFQLTIVSGKHKGKRLYHRTSLQKQALFNLRNTLEALGVEVPDRVMQLNLDSLIGKRMVVTVENETYQGRQHPRVVDVLPVEDYEDSENEEEEDEEEDEEEEEEDEEEDEDL